MARAKSEFTVTSVPAPGRMHVDWEERVDFRRLHEYRLGRARQAIAGAGLGAVLVFDMNNIRYLTSTTIGEWARDKVARFYLAVSSIGQGHTARVTMLNGLPAVVIDTAIAPPRVAPRSVMQVDVDTTGRIQHIYVVSATSKLSALNISVAQGYN